MDSVDGTKGVQVSSHESFPIDCDPCEYNQISKKAAAYCQECEEYLCEPCKTAHEKLRLTRSHKLLSGELMPLKRSARKGAVLDTVMCSCMKNEVFVYCKEHCSLVCVNCGALHHRRCHTSDIGDISKDFDVDSTEETIDNWNELNETLTSLAESREEDLSNLSLEAKDCRDRAKQFRKELSIKLESMEAKTLSEIDILKTQEKKTITQQLDTCKAAQNSLDTDRRNLILAKERNDRQSIFVFNIQLSQAIKSLTTITDEITKEVYQPHISFECNPAISIAGDQDVGTVQCHTTRIPQQKDFDEMSVTARKQVNVDQDLGTVKCHTSRTPQQMGRREQVDWLSLSSWCLRIVVWLFLAVPWVCLEFLIGVFTDHTVKCHSTRTLQQKGLDEMSVTARNQVNVKVPSDSCNARITGSAFLTSRESTRTLQQKGFDEMSVTARNQVNVKVPSDTRDAHITGAAFLPSGQLILCDYINNNLKLLDENLQMKESIDLPKAPWDIAVVNQHQVIVTFLCQQYLQFIQVTPSLALGHTVYLGMQCWGVTVSRESIYISFSESGEGKIGIYDLTGKKKRIIDPYNDKDGKVLIYRPCYIAVSNDEKLFVSDSDGSSTPTVYCLESNGNVLYTVSNPLFKDCSGISVDENENLLVCDVVSHKVFLITKDGKEVREFLTGKDGLSYPYTVSFRPSDGTLVVGGVHKNILVFTLK